MRKNKLDVYKRPGVGAVAKFLSSLPSPVPRLKGSAKRPVSVPTGNAVSQHFIIQMSPG